MPIMGCIGSFGIQAGVWDMFEVMVWCEDTYSGVHLPLYIDNQSWANVWILP